MFFQANRFPPSLSAVFGKSLGVLFSPPCRIVFSFRGQLLLCSETKCFFFPDGTWGERKEFFPSPSEQRGTNQVNPTISPPAYGHKNPFSNNNFMLPLSLGYIYIFHPPNCFFWFSSLGDPCPTPLHLLLEGQFFFPLFRSTRCHGGSFSYW